MAKPIRALAVVAVGALGLAACASGSNSGTGSNGGGGGKTLIVSTDLPLQGSNKDASDSTNNAIDLYLKSVGNKAGDYTVQLQKYDDSTAAAAKWDQAQCQTNAQKHASNPNEVAVMGTLNSGCAKIEVPGAQPGPQRPDADGVARQHQRGPDPTVGRRRAEQVLPDGQAQLRPRGHYRRRPGRGGGDLRRAGPSA